jgi:type IV pilus assembly protein PilY1
LASEPPDPASDDAYIGHIFAPPVLDDVNPSVTTQITRMNDGRWAVIMGNGYNSVNQKPALLIQYLDGDNELFVSSALVAGDADSYGTSYYAPVGGTPVEYPNGLSAPRVVDLNGDGTADVVYAGDLRGNLWKFDLTSTEPSEWKVAFDGAPLYSAAQTTGNSGQPIFAPPTVKANDVPGVGGVMVAFGTGMNVTVADRNNTNLQTLYSVLDNTRYEKDSAHSGKLKVVTTARGSPGQPGYVPAPTVVGSGTSMLQEQTIGASSTGDGRTFWNLSDNDVDWANEKKGWYLNLTGTSERLLKAMSFYAGTNILAVFTQVPATGASSSDPEVESCTGSVTAEKQYFTLINIVDGKSPSIPLMDRNGDGFYNATDGGVSRTQISGGATKIVYGQKTAKVFSGGVGGAGGGGGNCAAGDPSCVSPRLPPEVPIRPSWRQL